MKKLLIILFFLLLVLKLFAQDPRRFNHGINFVAYTNSSTNQIEYYLTWSSAFNNAWEHDIYNQTFSIDINGNIQILSQSQIYIGNGSDEAQEPVNLAINLSNNNILSVWEDGIDIDAPNVRGQLHLPNGNSLKSNWIIAGGTGSQHSAVSAHLSNTFLIFYADEAPPSTGGAVLKAKVINDTDGNELQTINFTPNNEDHWWPVTISNSSENRTLIVWGNDGFSARGAVIKDDAGTIVMTQNPQDYLVNTQQYFYQVNWLDNISKFLLIARDGAFNNITQNSKVCLIDEEGNKTTELTIQGGLLREAKPAIIWNECSSSYYAVYPTGINDLTILRIVNNTLSYHSSIIGNSIPELQNITWPSTGIWSDFVKDINGNDQWNGNYVSVFVFNDINSNDAIVIPISFNESLFCATAGIEEFDDDSIIIYPNPVNDNYVTIKFTENVLVETIKIYNVLGQEVFAERIQSSDKEIIVQLNLSKGVYLIQINSVKNISIHKTMIVE